VRLWLIFVQTRDRQPTTWLEAAWDDESTAENNDGWQAEVKRVEKIAQENDYAMVVCSTDVPGVYELFDAPELQGTVAEPEPPESGG
jgi:hypothetical protein